MVQAVHTNHFVFLFHCANRIVGRSALLEIAKKHEDSSNNYALSFASLPKPLYCHALSGQVICFAGFKKMEELVRSHSDSVAQSKSETASCG